MKEIRLSNLSYGQVDGSDGDQIPPGAFFALNGFEVAEKPYPRTIQNWFLATTPKSQLATGVSCIAGAYWDRPTGSQWEVAVVDGEVWRLTTGHQPAAILNIVSDGVNAGTLTGTTITPSSTADLIGSLQVGDKFYFDADTVGAAKTIATITAASFTISAYTGADSGAYNVIRHLSGTEVDIVPVGNRLFFTDGVKRPQWFGDNGSGTDIWREAGMPAPGSDPTVTRTATGGVLATGTYHYAMCYEDAAGRYSNPVYSQDFTVTNATEKVTITGIPRGPSWATKVHLFRTIADGDVEYSICPTVSRLKGATLATGASAGITVLTLNASVPDLVPDAYIHRYFTFAATETAYRITDNATTTITLAGTGTTVKAAESATDLGEISSGFDYDKAIASGVVDLIADTSLDTLNASPDENNQPPTGLKYLHKFRGGGRLIAYKNDTATTCWISGRTTSGRTASGDASNGEGEFDYWPTYQEAGPQDGDKVAGFANVGRKTLAIKNHSIWDLFQDPDSVDEWRFVPRSNNAGSFSHKSIIEVGNWVYFVGLIDNTLDLIRTNGYQAYRVLTKHRRRFRGPVAGYTLDSINRASLSTICAGLIGDRLLFSFATGTNAFNTALMMFNLRRETVAVWTTLHGVHTFFKPIGNQSGVPILVGSRAGATTSSRLYEFFSPNGETGSATRYAATGDLTFGEDTAWSDIEIDYINDATAPTVTIAYSTDGLWPSTGQAGKAWKTVTAGETWQSTTGRVTVIKHLAGIRSKQIALKLTSTSDSYDWGIKGIRVRGVPYPQIRAEKT